MQESHSRWLMSSLEMRRRSTSTEICTHAGGREHPALRDKTASPWIFRKFHNERLMRPPLPPHYHTASRWSIRDLLQDPIRYGLTTAARIHLRGATSACVSNTLLSLRQIRIRIPAQTPQIGTHRPLWVPLRIVFSTSLRTAKQIRRSPLQTCTRRARG